MNLYYMIMAVLFIDGRVAYRRTERIPLEVPCTFTVDGEDEEAAAKAIEEYMSANL